MNSFVSALALMSMLVAVAMSSDCSTGCSAQCALANTACEGTGTLGPLCAINHGACNGACAALCGCVDKCLANCETPFQTCANSAKDNAVILLVCSAERDVCLGACNTGCAAENTIATVQGVLAGGNAGAA